MSALWLCYVLFSVLGAAAYNVSMRLAGEHINPFIFTVGLSCVALLGHVICFFAYKVYWSAGAAMPVSKTALSLMILAGLGVVVIDLCSYFAIKAGGVVATNILFTVGAMLLTTLAGFFIFKEALTPTKMAGLAFGALSLILLSKP